MSPWANAKLSRQSTLARALGAGSLVAGGAAKLQLASRVSKNEPEHAARLLLKKTNQLNGITPVRPCLGVGAFRKATSTSAPMLNYAVLCCA
eukprot:3834384-Pyramimonas_sp.AAC.1